MLEPHFYIMKIEARANLLTRASLFFDLRLEPFSRLEIIFCLEARALLMASLVFFDLRLEP